MSNPLRKMFETDKSVERDGIVVEYAPGVEIRIARAGGSNKKFRKVLTRLTQPYRRAIQTETIDENILLDILQRAYAQAIIVGWKGITKDLITHNDSDADTELEFNEENCLSLLKEQPNLFMDIQQTSSNIALFRQDILEADSGN